MRNKTVKHYPNAKTLLKTPRGLISKKSNLEKEIHKFKGLTNIINSIYTFGTSCKLIFQKCKYCIYAICVVPK